MANKNTALKVGCSQKMQQELEANVTKVGAFHQPLPEWVHELWVHEIREKYAIKAELDKYSIKLAETHNHAQALAAALSHLLSRPEDASEYEKAEAILADWEGAQK